LTEIFLGIIAAALVVSTAIQVAAALAALKVARRINQLAETFEQEVRPIVSNLQTLSADAARATALAAGQIERADQLVTTLSRRVDETAATVQNIILQPMRDGLAVIEGLKAVIAAFRQPKEAGRKQPPAGHDDDLFVG
jgi:hypothetical protein